MLKIPEFIILLFLVLFMSTPGFTQMHSEKDMNSNQNMKSGSSIIEMIIIDQHFIEKMIPHHQDAIDMAKLALKKSKKSEIKKLSQDIITSQTAEIKSMKKLYKDLFGADLSAGPVNKNPAGNDMGMMSQGLTLMDISMSHVMMGGSIDDLKNAPDFDRKFIEMMVSHHKMAVTMSGMLLDSKKSEMRKLGRDIITAQTGEIEMMIKWYQNWYGSW